VTQFSKRLVQQDVLSYGGVLAKDVHRHKGGIEDMLPS
jgi:hypothetical protein